MKICDGFIKTTEKSSMGKEKDSCLKCGRTEEAHNVPRVYIYFSGKIYAFKNWEEAREQGFFVG